MPLPIIEPGYRTSNPLQCATVRTERERVALLCRDASSATTHHNVRAHDEFEQAPDWSAGDDWPTLFRDKLGWFCSYRGAIVLAALLLGTFWTVDDLRYATSNSEPIAISAANVEHARHLDFARFTGDLDYEQAVQVKTRLWRYSLIVAADTDGRLIVSRDDRKYDASDLTGPISGRIVEKNWYGKWNVGADSENIVGVFASEGITVDPDAKVLILGDEPRLDPWSLVVLIIAGYVWLLFLIRLGTALTALRSARTLSQPIPAKEGTAGTDLFDATFRVSPALTASEQRALPRDSLMTILGRPPAKLRVSAIILAVLGGPLLTLAGLCCVALAVWMLFLKIEGAAAPILLGGTGLFAAVVGAAITIWLFRRLRTVRCDSRTRRETRSDA